MSRPRRRADSEVRIRLLPPVNVLVRVLVYAFPCLYNPYSQQVHERPFGIPTFLDDIGSIVVFFYHPGSL